MDRFFKNELIKRLLSLLESQKVVEFLIGYQMWCFKIHEIVNRQHDARYDISAVHEKIGHHHRRCRRRTSYETADHVDHLERADQERLAPQAARNACRESVPAPRGRQWDWRHMPRLPRLFAYYGLFSNAYLSFVLLKNLYPELIYTPINWLFKPNLPAHCYVMGHFVAQKSLESHLAMLIAFYHLTWRLMLWFCQRPYFFTLYVFLAMTDRDLDQFYQMLDYHNQRERLKFGAASGARRKQALHARANRLFERQLAEELLQGHRGEPKTRRSVGGKKVATKSTVTELFTASLCYPVKDGHQQQQILYRLKPNRSPEARRILRHHSAKAMLLIAIVLLISGLMVVTLVSWQMLDVRRYLRHYKGCDARLDALVAANRWAEVSLPFTWHHLISMAMDVLENFIMWYETGNSTLFSWVATYLLNYDAELYWHQMDVKLRNLHDAVMDQFDEEAEHQQRHQWQDYNFEQPFNQQSKEAEQQLTIRELDQSRICLSDRMTTARRERNPTREREQQLSQQKYELQVEFYEFFKHIEQIDLIVADMIGEAFFICISIFAVLGQLAAVHARKQQSESGYVAIIIFCEALVFVTVSLGSLAILKLQRQCQTSYKTICSLMAYDLSDRKESFVNLLEFFVVTKRSAYTLFHQFPFTRTTFLSIFGWSFSCFFIIHGFGQKNLAGI